MVGRIDSLGILESNYTVQRLRNMSSKVYLSVNVQDRTVLLIYGNG